MKERTASWTLWVEGDSSEDKTVTNRSHRGEDSPTDSSHPTDDHRRHEAHGLNFQQPCHLPHHLPSHRLCCQRTSQQLACEIQGAWRVSSCCSEYLVGQMYCNLWQAAYPCSSCLHWERGLNPGSIHRCPGMVGSWVFSLWTSGQLRIPP